MPRGLQRVGPRSRRRWRSTRTGALAALSGLVLAGCVVTVPAGSAPDPSLSIGATSIPVAPFDLATSGPDESITAIHVAPDLEALLPGAIDGTPLATSSGTGSDVFRGDAWSREMSRFLTGLGKSPADFRYAQAWDPSQKLTFELEAFKVPGVDASRLGAAVVDAVRAGTPDITASSSVIGGKTVVTIVYPNDPATLHVYEHDGVVFVVATGDPSLASSLLGSLP